MANDKLNRFGRDKNTTFPRLEGRVKIESYEIQISKISSIIDQPGKY